MDSRVAQWLNSPASGGDVGGMGSIPGSGRSHGRGKGYALQYFCLGNPMDRGTWWATSHGGHKESFTAKQLSMDAKRRIHSSFTNECVF